MSLIQQKAKRKEHDLLSCERILQIFGKVGPNQVFTFPVKKKKS
jgi:hypothetical protein